MIQRPVFVKPEGFPVEKVQSVFQCKEEGDMEEVELDLLELPGEEYLVEGSQRAWVGKSIDTRCILPEYSVIVRLLSTL